MARILVFNNALARVDINSILVLHSLASCIDQMNATWSPTSAAHYGYLIHSRYKPITWLGNMSFAVAGPREWTMNMHFRHPFNSFITN